MTSRTATMASEIPVFPPWWFVQQWNAQPHRRGKPYAGITDPLVMLAWHLATEDLRKPGPLLLITGI